MHDHSRDKQRKDWAANLLASSDLYDYDGLSCQELIGVTGAGVATDGGRLLSAEELPDNRIVCWE